MSRKLQLTLPDPTAEKLAPLARLAAQLLQRTGYFQARRSAPPSAPAPSAAGASAWHGDVPERPPWLPPYEDADAWRASPGAQSRPSTRATPTTCEPSGSAGGRTERCTDSRRECCVRCSHNDASMPLGPVDPLRLLSSMLQMSQSASRSVMRKLRADHTTLHERSLRSYSGVMAHAYLHAAIAPSRRIRPLNGDAMADVAALLSQSLGLPSTPAMAGPHSQRFETTDDADSPTRTLFVTSSGVLEMLWALKQTPTDDASWSISALDACAALARFTTLVQGAVYRNILGRSHWSRYLHSRVDWSLGVMPSAMRENGPRGWRDIIVVGPQPGRATNHVYGFLPAAGYGATRLHNVKCSLDTREVLRTLLAEWLQANGYLRTSPAIDRTIDAALEQHWHS
jgi:hypothetical protein